MKREPGGLAAGAIAEAIALPNNTLSTHLAILARAGLVRGDRNGRSIIYHANVEGMRALMSFLVTDCCNGHPELCDFGGKQASDCCPPVSRGWQTAELIGMSDPVEKKHSTCCSSDG